MQIQTTKTKLGISSLLLVAMILFTSSCQKDAQTAIPDYFTMKVNNIPFEASWTNVTEGKTRYYVEGSDTLGLIGIYINKNHTYTTDSAEFVFSKDTTFYRALSDSFNIESAVVNGKIEVNFSGTMRSSSNKRILVIGGKFRF